MSEIKNIKINNKIGSSEKSLVFDSKEDLLEVYDMLENNKNFVLTYNNKSTLIIADNYYAQVKNGDIVLEANEK